MITKRTRTYMLHCTLGFRLLWRTHIPRYYPPPHSFLPVTQICRTCSTTPLKHARVSACTYAVKDSNWVRLGGGSIISHNMPAFRSAKKQDEEGRERRRQIFSGYSRNVQAAGEVGRCIRLSLFLECCFYSANILTVFPPNSPP